MLLIYVFMFYIFMFLRMFLRKFHCEFIFYPLHSFCYCFNTGTIIYISACFSYLWHNFALFVLLLLPFLMSFLAIDCKGPTGGLTAPQDPQTFSLPVKLNCIIENGSSFFSLYIQDVYHKNNIL